jgi:hypothetical protein
MVLASQNARPLGLLEASARVELRKGRDKDECARYRIKYLLK